jgi:hypothetical protein
MWQQLLYKIDYKHLYIYFVLFMFGFVLFLYLGHQSSDLSFLVVFLRVLRFPPTIKLTATI